ncbi:MAG: molybdate ABC transporter substrate-binding protein [Kiritimatiellae bacterium]|nr:molybdate ABC transporter substrate-binding protein [Kiritimatiellia bacterium]
MKRWQCWALAAVIWMAFDAAPAQETAKEPLLVHVGGTMRPAMEEICKLFEAETGVKTELNYNDSGSIVIAIETSRRGDVCVVHDPFMAHLERKGLVDRGYVVASLTPVIVVKKGNPKNIRGLKDLVRPDVKVGLTDAVYSTGGHVVEVIFRKAGIAGDMDKKEIVRARGGGEVANAVKIGTVDAAIVWNAVAFARKDELEAIPIDPVFLPDAKVDAITTATYGPIDMSCIRVTLMTLKTSKQLDVARRLADFASSDKGRAVFAKWGFSPAPERLAGSIFVYCGGGMKGPIEQIVRLFEKQTGVKVELTYANSGQLLGQMELTKQGDVYIPGDVGFIQKAQEKGLVSGQPREICILVPIILVRKGNPKQVREVADLAKPGLRLALTAETAAIGPVQNQIFAKNGVDLALVRQNTVVSPPMVTDTVLAVKMGTADAAIVWEGFSTFAPDETEAIRIPEEKNVVATAGACVLNMSKNPRAAGAFLEFLTSEAAQEIFKTSGYSIRAGRGE